MVFSKKVGASVAALLALASPLTVDAQRDDGDDPDAPIVMEVEAARLEGQISIDGYIDEESWEAAVPASGFITREPVEGEVASEQTEVRVLYSDGAIYIAARMSDSDPTSIADQLVRRDGRGQYDHFQVAFDPNLDQRTGYGFQVSAAGVQRDYYIYDDERTDEAWDAVWESAVRKDEGGWTAEMRIPLSQIRYEADQSVQTWGVNFGRRRVASNEESYYAPISRLRAGLASQFGLLRGVEVTKPSRRLEVRPYVLSAARRGPSEEGNPFFDGSEMNTRTGFELSYGLGANFTVDATVNPDFGQVEADPAVINLSAFEVFQDERRPFFVEDARVFDFDIGGWRDALFYSRRIGRRPSGGRMAGADFSNSPESATILGAAKLSGRTSSGLSIGVLGSVTEGEQGQAFFANEGRFEDYLVEPRSYQGVVRLRQDLNGGLSQVGGIVTVLNRDLPDDGSFDFLTGQAYSAGVDFEHQWAGREWALSGFFATSYVLGEEEAIQRIQRSSNHFFQRPDATRLTYDPTATSMNGASWQLNLAKQRGKHWTGSAWVGQITPGFEINDLGYSRSSEELDGGARVTYREIRPGNVFRNYAVTMTSRNSWSHEALDDAFSLGSWGRSQTDGVLSLNFRGELLNWWNVSLGANYRSETISRTATRGGPIMLSPASWSTDARISSDRRKMLSVGASAGLSWGSQGSGDSFRSGLDVTFRPSPRLQLSVEPGYSTRTEGSQYVTSTDVLDYEPTFGRRYVFAELDRTSFSMETRLNVTFSPSLTLELFAQPLLSSIDYARYKQLSESRSFDFDTFEDGELAQAGDEVFCAGGQICSDGDTRFVDFDEDGVTDFSFRDRDFGLQSLIGNAVLRWEYRPGSTVFFVWQRSQAGRNSLGDWDFGRDVDALFSAPAENRFIVKVNYWLGL